METLWKKKNSNTKKNLKWVQEKIMFVLVKIFFAHRKMITTMILKKILRKIRKVKVPMM